VQEFQADGLRVDAVASRLYLDYSRAAGEWVPNEHGGRENLEAVAFLRELNEVLHAREPGVSVIAEESTAWPGVSRPTSAGGLGFTFKWNMGWMHDTLSYLEHEPVHRRFHHDELTLPLLYAWNENFVLPLSHDEVVHGKGSLVSKFPGDRWQKLATLRALLATMWAHPGKQLLFMGGELAQWNEWSESESLDWALLDDPGHAGVRDCVRDLNTAYRAAPALWEVDFRPEGFAWLDSDARDENVVAFARFSLDGHPLVCVANFAPVVRVGWLLPLPRGGAWREVLNTDSRFYAGSDVGNGSGVEAEPTPLHGQPYSASVTLPPLATVWLVPQLS
jgi:1,4-alpha-glucan branching enzyme